MNALSMGINFYRKYNVELSQLIHHSDRGVQYRSYRKGIYFLMRMASQQICLSFSISYCNLCRAIAAVVLAVIDHTKLTGSYALNRSLGMHKI